MARRRLELLARKLELPSVLTYGIGFGPGNNFFDNSVDRTTYNTGAGDISPLAGTVNFILVPVFGQRAGAASGTTNSISSVNVIGGTTGRTYPCSPLHAPQLHNFGRLIQHWGTPIKNWEMSVSAQVNFANTQTRCSMMLWTVQGAETIRPYSVASVQGAPGTGDLSGTVKIPEGGVALIITNTEIGGAAHTWSTGSAEVIGNVGFTINSTTVMARGANFPAGTYTITKDWTAATPTQASMQIVVLR